MSLTSVIEKILKKIIKDKVVDHLDKFKLIRERANMALLGVDRVQQIYWISWNQSP